MLVHELMLASTMRMRPHDSIRTALRHLRGSKFNGVPVVDGSGRLIGYFSRSNLFDCLLADLSLDTPIQGHYIPEPVHLPEEKSYDTLEELTHWLQSSRVGQTVVVNRERQPIGVLTQAATVMDLLGRTEYLYNELSSVIQNVPAGIVATDGAGVVTLVNQWATDILPELKAGSQIGDCLRDLAGDFAPIARGAWSEPRKIEHGALTLTATAVPVHQNAEVKGVIFVIQDLTDEVNRLNMQLDYYKDELYKVNGTSYTIGSIVSGDSAISTIKSQILQVARSNSTVLITGESGTGKELFAHSLHNASSRRKEPFIKVNCSAIPAELAEAELFGYEDGAFTGARKQGKPGKFELAGGGTIFLDEIGDLPLLLQGKLLRVIQEREVERVGDVKTRKVDVRVIAATNRDMRRLVAEGKFREDLYFRLNVIEFRIPPLRERRGDIPLLVDHFVAKYNALFSRRVAGATPTALEALARYGWQGNVRELENIVERMLNYLESGQIDLRDLPQEIRVQAKVQVPGGPQSLATLELEAIRAALAQTEGNKAKAARILGISRSKLYEKLAQCDLGS